jgi:NADH-quinone oxidoreductase subunit M
LYSINKSLSVNELYNLKIDNSAQMWLFWFIFIAFAIKIPIFPFHSWQAETYKESPTTGTMLLSGIMLKMGLFGIIKWLIPILPYATKVWTPIVIVLCVIGVIYGAILTFSQKNTKHFLAYSSLSHVGLIAAGVFSFNSYGWQGAVIQMIAHAINVVGLFFVVEIIARRTGTYTITELGGIRQQSPLFATFFMVILFSSISLPLTNAFVGEYLLFLGLFQYNEILAIVSGISVILGAAYMLWFYQKTMLGETKEKSKNFAPLHWSEIIVLGLIVIITIGFGIYPQPIIDTVQPTLEEILKFRLK